MEYFVHAPSNSNRLKFPLRKRLKRKRSYAFIGKENQIIHDPYLISLHSYDQIIIHSDGAILNSHNNQSTSKLIKDSN